MGSEHQGGALDRPHGGPDLVQALGAGAPLLGEPVLHRQLRQPGRLGGSPFRIDARLQHRDEREAQRAQDRELQRQGRADHRSFAEDHSNGAGWGRRAARPPWRAPVEADPLGAHERGRGRGPLTRWSAGRSGVLPGGRRIHRDHQETTDEQRSRDGREPRGGGVDLRMTPRTAPQTRRLVP